MESSVQQLPVLTINANAPDELEAAAVKLVREDAMPIESLYVLVRRCEPDGTCPMAMPKFAYSEYDESALMERLKPGKYKTELMVVGQGMRGVKCRRDFVIADAMRESFAIREPMPVAPPAVGLGADPFMQFMLQRLSAAEDRTARLMEKLFERGTVQPASATSGVVEMIQALGELRKLARHEESSSGGDDALVATAIREFMAGLRAAPSPVQTPAAPSAASPPAATTPIDMVRLLLLQGAHIEASDPDDYASVIADTVIAAGQQPTDIIANADASQLCSALEAQYPDLKPHHDWVYSVCMAFESMFREDGKAPPEPEA